MGCERMMSTEDTFHEVAIADRVKALVTVDCVHQPLDAVGIRRPVVTPFKAMRVEMKTRRKKKPVIDVMLQGFACGFAAHC